MLIVQLDNSYEASPQALLKQPLKQRMGREAFVEIFGDITDMEKRFQTIAEQFSPSRASAIKRLHALDVEDYGKTRNHIDGGITKLSAFIESGLLSETEIVEYLRKQLDDQWPKAYRFVQQLSWREFFQQKWRRDFMAPWQPQQVYKTGWHDEDYQQQIPGFIEQANTDSVLINQLIVELKTTGFLHNHGRLYLASYIVHWCRVHWKTGAQWMLHYLIDGNIASNHFSWQWVASTNSPKPYIFNLENAQRFCGNRYDTTESSNDSLAASYEELYQRLFPNFAGDSR